MACDPSELLPVTQSQISYSVMAFEDGMRDGEMMPLHFIDVGRTINKAEHLKILN